MEDRLLTRLVRSRLFWAGVVLAGLGLVAFYAFLDEAPPQVADLVCPREEVPPIENGLLLLDFRKEDLYWPKLEVPLEEEEEEEEEVQAEEPEEGEEVEEQTSRTVDPTDLAHGTFWDSAWARDVLAGNEEILRKVDEALRLPHFQLPEFSTMGEAVDHASDIPLLRISYLIQTRIRLHKEEGREEEAIKDAFRVVTLGHRLVAAHGPLIHFMIGTTVKNIGLEQVIDLFQRGVSDPCASAVHGREIQRMTSNEHLASTFKAEYAFVCEYTDAWREHLDDPFQDTPWIWRNPFCMKPNQTKRLYAEAMRMAIENIALLPGSRRPILPRGIPTQELPRWLPYPNALGKSGLKDSLKSFEHILSAKAQHDTILSFTVALVAIRCWQARHGALPPTLDALVPEYLDAVPRDPYDGKPLRYSAEKRIVHSVGMDGVDSGGSAEVEARNALWDGTEPTLRIEARPTGE